MKEVREAVLPRSILQAVFLVEGVGRRNARRQKGIGRTWGQCVLEGGLNRGPGQGGTGELLPE